MNSYDVAIIGGGPGGYTAAFELSGRMKVCLIEKCSEHLGGTCLNDGCIPMKSFLQSAEVAETVRHSAQFGIESELKAVRMGDIRSITTRHIELLRKGIESRLKNGKIETIWGEARFLDAHRVAVSTSGGEIEIQAQHFIIATGSLPRRITGVVPDGKTVFDNESVFQMDTVPQRVAIIGGGYIGCEFASFFRKLGTETTVLEALPRILANEDDDVVRALEREWKKQGIEVITGCKIEAVESSVDSVSVRLSDKTVECDAVVSATGRVPNTQNLNLAAAGIHSDSRGFIPINSRMQTSQSHIYAVGDVIPTLMLAHTAVYEGKIAAETILGDTQSRVYPVTPRIVFCDPQIGCAGITEKEAVASGLKVKTYTAFFKSNGKATVMQKNAGLVKWIVDEETGILLGAAIVGENATELIHTAEMAIQTRTTADEFRHRILGHPTLTELIGEI